MKEPNIKKYLPLVRKPGRYIGGEINSIKKDLSKVKLKFGLGFPDAYEVGMSHLGIQILYQILNSREDIACERVFAPWFDMEALLRQKGARLSTLENSIPLDELDIMGFSLQYELSYTNVLSMLELGNIPLSSSERSARHPFIIGGGPAAFNPEPVAEFFDAFLLGDGEEAVLEIAECVMEAKRRNERRLKTLERLARIKGVYVPFFFSISYNDDQTVKRIMPLLNDYRGVHKRFVPDINKLPLPIKPVVPFCQTIHDRISVEISRGCTRGCRFCQAGMIYRPVRERTPELIVRILNEALRNTGYDEVSLLSLSTGDYTLIDELLKNLMSGFSKRRIAVSLPSLRVGTLNAQLATEIKKVRKTGFTLAPEAGSERLRKLINKGIKEEDLMAALHDVFSLGWNLVKLYFMIGLPTETDEDVMEIVRVADCVRKVGKTVTGRWPQVNVSVASFIPKPFTPFQWEAQMPYEECVRKQNLLRKELGKIKAAFKWHEPKMSVLEGVFSRGDRNLSKVILNAYKKGCRFDGWSDEFRFDKWKAAFNEEGVSIDFYTQRKRGIDEVFPWEHLDPGMRKKFLYEDFERAVSLASTPDCKVDRCSNCGVCDHKLIKNRPVRASRIPEPEHEESRVPEPVKARIRFSKTGDIRLIGHLELTNAFVRAIRRAGLPLKYSQGFHPLPKISFSQPLPVGIESLNEFLDIEFESKVSAEEIKAKLNAVLPEGIEALEAELMPLKTPAPSAIMDSVEYLIDLNGSPEGLNIELERIDGFLRDFLSKDSVRLTIEKEGKTAEVDIRPLVTELALEGSKLRLVLKRGQPGAKPADVLSRLFGISRESASLIPILKTGAVRHTV